MAAAIRAYLDDRLTSYQFDGALTKVAAGTQDTLVQYVRDALWLHYDDLQDHLIVASRWEWDHLCRPLLALEASAPLDVKTTRGRKWTPRQVGAAIALAAFVGVALQVGWSLQMLFWSATFGIVSQLLEVRWGSRTLTVRESALLPFESVPDLLHVRRCNLGFTRPRYREELGSRRIRGNADVWAFGLLCFGYRLAFAPMYLLMQAIPKDRSDWTLILAR
jgi:hypothetical protein